MGSWDREATNPWKTHRFISLRQYAVAALAAAASAGLWWLITRRSSVPSMTLAFGLLLPLGAHRDRERTWFRILWAFIIGAVVAAGDWNAHRNGWVR